MWSDWFLPGLHDGLWLIWPLLAGAALAGLVLCLAPFRALPRSASAADRALWVAGLSGLAAVFAWLIAPASASGPDGIPRGFESGLRYLAPALVLGLALLPVTPVLRGHFIRISSLLSHFPPHTGGKYDRTRGGLGRRSILGVGAALVALAIAIGYPVQRHYLDSRYSDPSFTTPGLNAAFEWSRDLSGARIATTSTRQYPLFGTDLSNQVDFVGIERPHGGFTPPTTCPQWRRLLNKSDYDYVVASRDRIEPGKPPYPPTATWTEGSSAKVVLRTPPTVIFRLSGLLDPSSCQ